MDISPLIAFSAGEYPAPTAVREQSARSSGQDAAADFEAILLGVDDPAGGNRCDTANSPERNKAALADPSTAAPASIVSAEISDSSTDESGEGPSVNADDGQLTEVQTDARPDDIVPRMIQSADSLPQTGSANFVPERPVIVFGEAVDPEIDSPAIRDNLLTRDERAKIPAETASVESDLRVSATDETFATEPPAGLHARIRRPEESPPKDTPPEKATGRGDGSPGRTPQGTRIDTVLPVDIGPEAVISSDGEVTPSIDHRPPRPTDVAASSGRALLREAPRGWPLDEPASSPQLLDDGMSDVRSLPLSSRESAPFPRAVREADGRADSHNPAHRTLAADAVQGEATTPREAGSPAERALPFDARSGALGNANATSVTVRTSADIDHEPRAFDQSPENPVGRPLSPPDTPPPSVFPPLQGDLYGTMEKSAVQPHTAQAPLRVSGDAADEFQVVSKGGSASLEMTVDTDSAGALRIELLLNRGVIHAQIHTSDESGKHLIERNLSGLLQSLIHEGLQVGTFSVSLRGKQSGRNDASSPDYPEIDRVTPVHAPGRSVPVDRLISIFV